MEEVEDGGDGEVVCHSIENLLEDEDVVEGSVGVVGFDAIDFSQVLEAVARQVGAISSCPLEGVKGFPAGWHDHTCSGEFSAHEGHVEAFAVVGDEDDIFLAKFEKGFSDGGKVCCIGDHSVGDAADAGSIWGDRAPWVDKFAEGLACSGI